MEANVMPRLDACTSGTSHWLSLALSGSPNTFDQFVGNEVAVKVLQCCITVHQRCCIVLLSVQRHRVQVCLLSG